MSRQFANQEGVTVRTADSVSDALHAGATHLIHTRLSGQPAGGELTVEIETVAGSKFERAGVIRAGTGIWLKAAVKAANLIRQRVAAGTGALAPPGVNGEAAMTQLGLALAAQAEPLDAAANAHPDCGWCWEASAERHLAGGDRAAALEVAQQGRQAPGVDGISRARLELLESGISGDTAMRAAALAKLAQLTPSNTEVLAELGVRATNGKQWVEAARTWKRVLAVDPGSTDAMNQLGYIEAWQGRFDDGVKWLKAYETADPAAANANDSLGEVLLMAGRFDEAERAFAESYRKGPDMNAGAAMEKAALACWLRGDEAGARQHLEVFLKDRAGRGDPLVDWRRARWLYITGKADEARQVLEAVRAQGAPPARVFALASLALWSFEAGDRAAAETHLATLSATPHPAAGRIARIVSAIVKPGSTQPAGKLQEGIAALLSGDDAKAVTLLRAALETAAPGDEWLARELLAWGYVRTGDVAASAALLRAGWPIPAALEGQLTDYLVYPNLFYVRAKVALHNGDAAGAAKLFEVYVKFIGMRPDSRHQKEAARKAVRL
jgi:tetratricopeptide (TPR) repeat protein